MTMPSEATRAWIYRIVLAVFAGLVVAGVISGDDLPVWTEIAAAVLGIGTTGLAVGNTSTKGG